MSILQMEKPRLDFRRPPRFTAEVGCGRGHVLQTLGKCSLSVRGEFPSLL